MTDHPQRDTPTRDDVRMRGFLRRTTVEAAREWVDQLPVPALSEPVCLQHAHGRVLAENVISGIDVPEFDRAAMDGFAVRGAETAGAGEYNPLEFSVIGESWPGRPFVGHVGRGQAVRIMTGAPLPCGADAVVPAEFVRLAGTTVAVSAPSPPLRHVGLTGEDIRRGDVALSAGRRLRPQDVGLLASLGIDRVSVFRRPRVRILVTGNELVRPGTPKGPYQIYEANAWMLRGLVERDGGVVESCSDLPDERTSIREALASPGADVILVSGGSSVGAEDHAPGLVAELGELAIHGVAMRPSSPTGLGRIGAAAVILLPGNPVSCLCAYDFFAGRLIRRAAGRPADWPHRRVRGVLQQKIVSAIGRVDYCRVSVSDDGIRPVAVSGASLLSSTTRADGFVIVPAEREGYAEGTEVDVLLYDEA